MNVLSAVGATTSNVLVLTGAVATPTRDARGLDATLMADVVDGSLLRVRGATSDGQPGLVGTVTVTVTDGASTTVTGQVAVFAASDAVGPPIAVPDSATVRVGAQVDIPVTANDVAPGGAPLQVVPGSVIGSDTPGEIVFASGNTVRYVAPNEPGIYVLRYSVAPVSFPEAVASTTVQVDVVAGGTNRDPVPPPLVARVVAGQSVVIAVPTRDVDPDGDSVVVVGVTQPPLGSGAASVADTGDAVVFQSSVTAATQQVLFTYRVRDKFAGEGTATVRVAVTAADTNSPPVAFTDRVRLRQGDREPAVLEPLLNDRDPAGGRLSIIAVRPDAPNTENNPEWNRLDDLLDTRQIDDGKVLVRAGDVLGVHAYVYTVRSSQTGSTVEGLLVVEVTASGGVDPPEAKDTIVTAARRAELSRDGIDVVTGKVSWPSGDASSLVLELWGADARYSVNGPRIVGPVPKNGALVPFTLRGTDRVGREVTAHAFLRIPAFDDMRVSGDPNAKVVQVEETGSVQINVVNRVALAAGDQLEVDNPRSFAVQRPEASCTPSGSGVLYRAGDGAPWADTCVVRVRLAGQKTWTDLVVPIQVTPKAPQPQLASTSRTIPPGASETIDLKSLTTWEGGRVGDESKLVYATSLSSEGFLLAQSGAQVTVTALASAVPGTRSTVAVTVAAFGGLRSTIDLVVGQAAPDIPRATVSATCDANRGSCTVALVGVPGEYDPFAGKPGAGLTLGGVSSAGCSFATVTAIDTKSAVVTWNNARGKPVGGQCQVPYTVRDAQERPGPGMLHLDLPGFPPTPSPRLVDAKEDHVVFDVSVGMSFPTVSKISVYRDGTWVADCEPYRWCTVYDVLVNRKQNFTFRAHNDVGESGESQPVQAWAYRAPVVTVETEVLQARSATEGRVRVTVNEPAGDANSFKIAIDDGPANNTQPRQGASTSFELVLGVGRRTIHVTPVSDIGPPTRGLRPPQAVPTQVIVIGAPDDRSHGNITINETTAQIVNVDIRPNHAPTLKLEYGMAESDRVSCVEGRPSGGRGLQTSTTPSFSMQYATQYWFVVCADNEFGTAGGLVKGASTFVIDKNPPQIINVHQISSTPVVNHGSVSTWSYQIVPPVVRATPGMTVEYSVDGQTWSPSFTWATTVSVRQCALGECSAVIQISRPLPTPPLPVTLTAQKFGCEAPDPFSVNVPSATGTATRGGFAPDGRATWIWTWTDDYRALGPVTAYSQGNCRQDDEVLNQP
ncbi:MAG: hypothetical protein FWE61_07410 [Micrococcales bacterium]|nr:hypothetical protein [Micrococcales bacterium]